ncbi:hypothetical protein GGQ18_000021 [Salinibacter ruber]|nr:hypothetical protein [Salinibacter ruber]
MLQHIGRSKPAVILPQQNQHGNRLKETTSKRLHGIGGLLSRSSSAPSSKRSTASCWEAGDLRFSGFENSVEEVFHLVVAIGGGLVEHIPLEMSLGT